MIVKKLFQIVTKWILCLSLLFLLACEDRKIHFYSKEIKQFSCSDSVLSLKNFQKIVAIAGKKGLFGLIDTDKLTINTSQLVSEGNSIDLESINNTNDNFFMIQSTPFFNLYKTGTHKMEVIYSHNEGDFHYNAMDFENNQWGAIAGLNPKNELSLLISKDGGVSWEKERNISLHHKNTLAHFQQNNESISIHNRQVFLVTSGETCAFVRYDFQEKEFKNFLFPIQKDSTMHYKAVSDFSPDGVGYVAISERQKEKYIRSTIYFTQNNGETFSALKTPFDEIKSIQILPMGKRMVLFALTNTGIFYTTNPTEKWDLLMNENFSAFSISEDTHLVGVNGKNIKAFRLETNL